MGEIIQFPNKRMPLIWHDSSKACQHDVYLLVPKHLLETLIETGEQANETNVKLIGQIKEIRAMSLWDRIFNWPY